MAHKHILYHPPEMYHTTRWVRAAQLLWASAFAYLLGDIATYGITRVPPSCWRITFIATIAELIAVWFACAKYPKSFLHLPKNPWQLPPTLLPNSPLDEGTQNAIANTEPIDPRLSPISAILSSYPLATISDATFIGDIPNSITITSANPDYISRNYQKIIADLKDRLHIKYSYESKIHQGLKNNIIVLTKLDDWFAKPERFILKTPHACANYQSVLGRDEQGDIIYLRWYDNSAMLIAGATGSGKTASTLPWVAGMAGINELVVADGKETGDWTPIRCLTVGYKPGCEENPGYIESQESDAIIPLLERANRLRAYRARLIKELHLPQSVWIMPWDKSCKPGIPIFRPLFIILDECQTWTLVEGKDSKADKANKAYIHSLLHALVLKARSSGVFVVFATQRPSTELLPSKIRSNVNMRIAYRLNDADSTRMVLPNLPALAPKPHLIPQATPDKKSLQGRCIVQLADGTYHEVQSNFIPKDRYPVLLNSCQPVPDQLAQARKLLQAHNIPIPTDKECGLTMED